MNDTIQGYDPNVSSVVPFKRKRGRPRKYPRSDTCHSSDQGASSGWSQSHNPVFSGNPNDNFIGQIVYGSVEVTFDAGYLLTVRVGNSDTTLRGAVFKPGRYVPVSPDNDVAPEVPMCERNEIPVPFEQFGQNTLHGGDDTFKTPRCKPLHSSPMEVCKGKEQEESNHFGMASGTSNGSASVPKQNLTEGFRSADAKSMSSSFESLLTEVRRRGEVPVPAMDDTEVADEEASESDETLSVEPLQELQPGEPIPAGLARPLEPFGSGKMTELLKVLQDNIDEREENKSNNQGGGTSQN